MHKLNQQGGQFLVSPRGQFRMSLDNAQMNGSARLLATLRAVFQRPPRLRYPVIEAH